MEFRSVGTFIGWMTASGLGAYPVAHHVIAAQTEQVKNSLDIINSSLGIQAGTVENMVSILSDIQKSMSELSSEASDQRTLVSSLQKDFDRLAAAVQDYGITVRISSESAKDLGIAKDLHLNSGEELMLLPDAAEGWRSLQITPAPKN